MNYIKTGIILLLVSIVNTISAQVTFLVNEFPENTPSDATMYISGDFEGWSGGQDGYQLSKLETGEYAITLDQRDGTIQFKFTLGSWSSVEKGGQGEEISNRTYSFGGNGDTVEVAVLNWANLSSDQSPSTAASNVSILSETFEIPQLNRSRRIWIYLPPNYESGTEEYPVLYMHDGQNVFDRKTSFAGEWEVDETLNTLYDEVGFELIVVAIDNGGTYRLDEYSPWVNTEYGGGDGDLYIDFIVETLKPHIDTNYRTKSSAENTGIMGSSMGGLISYYAILEYPEVFGKAGVFSPSFWFSDNVIDFTIEKGNIDQNRIYFLAGGNEGSLASQMEIISELLINSGFPYENQTEVIVPSGTHSESFWANEFEQAIGWLWQRNDIYTELKSEQELSKITIYPNPTSGLIYLDNTELSEDTSFKILNNQGQIVLSNKISKKLDLSNLRPGIYYLAFVNKNEQDYSQIIVIY